MRAAVQVEHEHAEERAQISAKLHLVKAAHKRLRTDMQAQVDKTAATAAELALSQVCSSQGSGPTPQGAGMPGSSRLGSQQTAV